MMRLVAVWKEPRAPKVLYDLLKERTSNPLINISHRALPSFEEHKKFIDSTPYTAWYLIEVDGDYVGSVYLSRGDEIGVFVFDKHWGLGYGAQATELIMAAHKRTRYLANINPSNTRSIRMFQRLGFKKLQVTYELRP